MNELVYSEELARLAAKEAEKCHSELPSWIKQRSLRLNSSLSDFKMFDSTGHPRWDPEPAFLIFFEDYRRSLRQPFSLENREWVQTGQILSFAEAKEIGCATARCYYESDYAVENFLFICLLDERIEPDNYAFKEGPPASACIQKSVSYPGLCIPISNNFSTKYDIYILIATVLVLSALMLLLKSKKSITEYKKPDQITETVMDISAKIEIA